MFRPALVPSRIDRRPTPQQVLSTVARPALTFGAMALSIVVLSVSANRLSAQTVPPASYTDEIPRYSANQLDNLLGPVALYPDALLAQVLVAATFPDQVEEAARFVRANGTAGIDDQNWDVSVKAVAHYASALNMMADKSDWTTTLGVAYANQSSDVMASVQRLRAMAAQQGNLVSTTQQQVVTEGNTYIIAPAQPRVLYVPVYDPVVIYTRPVFNLGFSSRFWSFGVGFPIGGWLSYDCDWGLNRVYYNGWNSAFYAYGGGWRARSRPFIQITNVYVSPRYRDVYVNRNVYRRPINYRNVDRYAGIHRDTYFDGRRDGYREGYRDGRDRDRWDDRNTGRTAQPRDGGPVATPDGYSRGARSTAPQDRRVEQTSTVRAMGIDPSYRRDEPTERPNRERSDVASRDGSGAPDARGVNGRVGGRSDDDAPREARPRGDRPRVEMPRIGTQIAPPPSTPPLGDDRRWNDRAERARQARIIDQGSRASSPPRASEPRQSPPRSSEPRQSGPRSEPRQAQPRQAQPRQESGTSRPAASNRGESRGVASRSARGSRP